MRIQTWFGLARAVTALALASDVTAGVTGQWDFNNSANRLAGTVGPPIEYLDGAGEYTQTNTQFGSTAALGIPNIGGTAAQVMAFPKMSSGVNGYVMRHGVPANGGGAYANQWTLIMDVLFPTSSSGDWRALIQSDELNSLSDDAEFYLNPGNGLGISSDYPGTVPPNTWVRLAVAVDLSATPNCAKYINGIKVGAQDLGGLDGRWALSPIGAVLFNDGYDAGLYTQSGYVNSIQMHDTRLTDGYLAAIGGPSAAGIPTAVQVTPFLRTVSPASGQRAAPPEIAFSATVADGVTKVDTNSIQLSFNTATVSPVILSAGGETRVGYQASGLLPADSTNAFTLVFADDSAPASRFTNHVQFVVAAYVDLQLPAPLYFENFDGTAEGSLPAGWSQTNYTDTSLSDPAVDFGNLDSAAFQTLTVVDASRFTGSFVTYSNPDNPQAWEDDYRRVLSVNPSNVVNGQFIKPLATGRFVFGDSGYRNGASQVMYLFSPDFDLTLRTNVNLSYHSLWEQNQDSIGAVEYSVDQGQTWLPIVYLLERGDILTNATGQVDALATLTNEYIGGFQGVAVYTDPADGLDKGGYYGAFIGVAPNLWSTLGPYLSARLDDDPVGSKRVELFRLSQADNQPHVRFRFAHAGTDSWYLGIDDFGLYSIPPSAAPLLSAGWSGGQLLISWPADAVGFTLEDTGSLTNPDWKPVNGVSGNSAAISIGPGHRFYRLRK